MVTLLAELTSLYLAPASSAQTTAPISFPAPCGVAGRTAAPQPPLLSQVSRGSTALLNPSTAASGMKSLTPSCSTRWLRPRAYPMVALGVQQLQGAYASPGACTPRGSSSRCCISTYSHCAWTNEEGYVCAQWRTAPRAAAASASIKTCRPWGTSSGLVLRQSAAKQLHQFRGDKIRDVHALVSGRW